MKNLQTHSLNAEDCRKEWKEFDVMLKSKLVLDERNAISCVSFNELSEDLDYWLTTYYRK
jgi:hypothetical protein